VIAKQLQTSPGEILIFTLVTLLKLESSFPFKPSKKEKQSTILSNNIKNQLLLITTLQKIQIATNTFHLNFIHSFIFILVKSKKSIIPYNKKQKGIQLSQN